MTLSGDGTPSVDRKGRHVESFLPSTTALPSQPLLDLAFGKSDLSNVAAAHHVGARLRPGKPFKLATLLTSLGTGRPLLHGNIATFVEHRLLKLQR